MNHPKTQEIPDDVAPDPKDLGGHTAIANTMVEAGCAVQRNRPHLTVYVPEEYGTEDHKHLTNDIIGEGYAIIRAYPLDAGPFGLKLELLPVEVTVLEQAVLEAQDDE